MRSFDSHSALKEGRHTCPPLWPHAASPLLRFFLVAGLWAAAGCATTPWCGGQTLARSLEGLFSAPSQQQPGKQESASQQVGYAQERAAAAKKRQEEFASQEFQKRLADAGIPEAQRPDFARESAAAAENWSQAVSVLQGILAREAALQASHPPPPPPQNARAALELDQELSSARQTVAQLEFEKKSQAEALEAAEQRLRLARRQFQLLEDSQKSAAIPPGERDILEKQLAETVLDAAQGAVFLLRWTDWRLRLDEQIAHARIAALEQALETGGFHRLLHPERASGQVEALGTRIKSLEDEDARVASAFEEASRTATALRERSEKNPPQDQAAAAALRRQLQQQLALIESQERLRAALQARLQLLRQARGIWSRAASLGDSPDLQGLRTLRAEIAAFRGELSNASGRVDRGLTEARNRLESSRLRLQSRGLTQAERATLQREQEASADSLEQLIALKTEIAELSALQEKLSLEIEALLLKSGAAENLSYYLRQAASSAAAFWQFPLLEQGGRPLTVGTLTTALVALALALMAARLLAMRLGGALRRRFGLAEAQADLAEKLTLYLASVALVLMVLQWLSIPLTVFAFLGGALAVGVGFGSQNLINNFISGLIVLLERKVSVGHLLEVDGRFGRVTSLGSRCASIQTFDGVEVLIPNSALLEKNVINWTLSDPRHRYDWRVGVGYDSDVEVVIATLREVIESRPEVLRSPEPEVAFEDFGDSSLIFHVYYWLEIGKCNPRQVASEMRREVMRLFRERGIEIPFPQREVHVRAGLEKLAQASAPSPNKNSPNSPLPNYEPPSEGADGNC